jgi:phage terminase small subunit
MAELNAKQRLFVAEYLKDLNATQAAIRAGYSAKTAASQGERLLRNVEIRRAIDVAMATREEKLQIDATWVLKRLVDMADADRLDLYDDAGRLLPVADWPEVWRKGMVNGIETEELFEGRGEERVQIGYVKKIRTESVLAVLQTIGKHVRVNAFQEQVNHTGLEALGDRLERALKRDT